MPSVLSQTARDDARTRFHVFTGLVIGLVVFLGGRLVQMQIIDKEQYQTEAAGNAIETKIVRPARGYIFDRNGLLLVDNETTMSVTVAPRYFDTADLPLIAELAGLPLEEVQARYDKIVERSAYQEDVLLENVPFWTFARLQENQYQLRGVNFREDQQRRYHGDARLTHALGFVNEIGEEELDEMREQGYMLGDRIGKSGIEAEYEPVLRGRVGRAFVLRNVHGMEVERYEGGEQDVAPESGFALTLAVDATVQALAESLFVNKRGGAVMMDAKTGGIISMVSAPDFDLSIYRDGFTQAEVDFLYRNPEQPDFNRATQTALPPGSTWKPFMGVIALQEGMIDENTTLFCGGGYVLGRLYRCHGGSHGNIALRDAIRVSCNTFFFRLMNDTFVNELHPNGIRMDLDRWGDWAHRFGFGQLAPLDIPNQNTGLIPDSSYYDRVFPAGWGPGYTVNLGIGQGNMGTSPLQLARYTAAIGNGGTLVTPHLVMAQTDPETGITTTPSRRRPQQIPIEPRNFQVVREGMEAVVAAGTARRAQIPAYGDFAEILVAGKTGTAENPRGKDHAVFIAYAPVDDPQVAVGVIVENAGFGSTTAAPIASLMIEQYFRGQIASPQRNALIPFVRAQRSVGRI
ncbi:penicillin-binding protein 2 [Rubrivirga sp. SAORIC476]|uniref:penicillin-binding protein 2 n=1 Tax=Rubrivirga sp. SAORIC476 TaxID=1961794 RepID=UPI000BA9391D|nr:penicillin-binding protein 2 [Rubrivirga sp. SAORIC476]PAP80987.1 penicillin-binding protein 2 [Rubrivirga sp. SAORIC476]